VTALQAWIIVGVPGALVLAALFVGRSRVRAMIGYVVLLLVLLVFVLVAHDPLSAAAFGMIAFVFVANGRGTHVDDDFDEHHEHRRRYTTDPSQA